MAQRVLLKFEEEVVRWLVEEVRKCSLVVEPEGNVMVEEEVVGEMVEVVMEEEELSLRVVRWGRDGRGGDGLEGGGEGWDGLEVMACFEAVALVWCVEVEVEPFSYPLLVMKWAWFQGSRQG